MSSSSSGVGGVGGGASRPSAAVPPGGSSFSATAARVSVGARCTIAQDTDIRGQVHFGNDTVVHPKALIHSLDEDGSIVFGDSCIIEEYVQIVHRTKGVLRIGEKNLFEVGAKVEARSIGSFNVFACKSRTLDSVRIQDFTTIGVACVAQPPFEWNGHDKERATSDAEEGDANLLNVYTFPSRTVIFGEQSTARIWSGNGVRQADALHAKHLDHLRRNLPEFHKLRIV